VANDIDVTHRINAKLRVDASGLPGLSLCSKDRCIGIRGSFGLPRAEGNKIVVVDDREGLGIVAALEIERLILGSVDVDDLTWF
jgi:hypothetical protein